MIQITRNLMVGHNNPNVEAVQARLKELKIAVSVHGYFDLYTETAVKTFQKEAGLKPDGIVGTLTVGALNRGLLYEPGPTPSPLPVPALGGTAYMDWMLNRLGWTEFKNDKQLSVYWKYTNVPGYKTTIGTNYAWCAMIVCAALEENGFKSTRDAGAISYDSYPSKSLTVDQLVYGAIVTIKRSGGSGRHVAFFVGYDKNGDMILLGGNQDNEINKTVYPRSRFASGHMPVRKAA